MTTNRSGPPYGLLACFFLLVMGWRHLAEAEEIAEGRSPREASQHLMVPPGLSATLFAAEPLVRQPILVKFDPRGRLWALQYLQYPNPAGLQRVQVDRYSRTVYDRVPPPPPHGPRGADVLTMLLDHNHDGVADEAVDQITGLNLATGLEFGYGGWFVLQVPYLLFYADLDGDDLPDESPEVLLSGFGMEDAQSLANHLTWGPDGWLYGVSGSTSTNRVCGIEFQQAVWRFHPRRHEFELFSEGGGNLFGLTFDERGQMFFSSNGGQVAYHGLQGAYFEKSFAKHGALHNPYAYGWFREIDKQSAQIGPTTGGTIYLGDSFPASYRGTFLGGDFLGHTVSWWSISPLGTTYSFRREGRLLDPQDRWTGPTDLCLAPDGSIYVSDFYDARTAHPDPDAHWDRSNGRIYRIQGESKRDAARQVDLPACSSDELCELLRHPNHWYRQRARVLLAERQDASTWPRLRAWARSSNVSESLEGLWALHVSGGLDEETILALLQHAPDDSRAWAVRLVGDERSVSPTVAAQLLMLAKETRSPLVLQQLASTAGRLSGPQAIPLLLALVDADPSAADDRLAWLIWWSVEKHAMAESDAIVSHFVHQNRWHYPASRRLLLLLVRRYAAAGTSESYDLCAKLGETAPDEASQPLAAAIANGLQERGAKVLPPGDGTLFAEQAVPRSSSPSVESDTFDSLGENSPLPRLIHRRWKASPDDLGWLQLSLQLQEPAATARAKAIAIDMHQSDTNRIAMLDSLAIFAPESLSDIAGQLDQPASDALRVAQLETLATSDTCLSLAMNSIIRIATQESDSPARQTARQVIFRRASSTLQLLSLVDQGRVAPEMFSLAELRTVAIHQDPQLDELVAKHWGTIRAGTPEEKLATMRRLMNDLRAASGDVHRGATLFRQHCATCHRLHGEGGQVGPDLTSANRLDREYLLTSIVDPNAVIRAEYANYAAVMDDGQILQGLLKEQNPEQVVIFDAKAQSHRLPRARVESLTLQSVSLMPEGLLEQLVPQDVRDLFAYLESHPPEK